MRIRQSKLSGIRNSQQKISVSISGRDTREIIPSIDDGIDVVSVQAVANCTEAEFHDVPAFGPAHIVDELRSRFGIVLKVQRSRIGIPSCHSSADTECGTGGDPDGRNTQYAELLQKVAPNHIRVIEVAVIRHPEAELIERRGR